MLYNHSEVKKIYNSDYQINRAVEDGKLFKLDSLDYMIDFIKNGINNNVVKRHN